MAIISDGRYAESSGYEPQRPVQTGEAREGNASMPAEQTPHARRYADCSPEGGPSLLEAMEGAEQLRSPSRQATHIVTWTQETGEGPKHRAVAVDSEELGQLLVEQIGASVDARVIPLTMGRFADEIVTHGRRLLDARKALQRAQLDAGGAESKIRKGILGLKG